MTTGQHPHDTVREMARAEIVVSRSRFIATLAPVNGEDAAHDVIAGVRAEFHDARHHCTAVVLGATGQRERSNDDGEPSGTAGAPMLAVLRGAGLTDVVAVVTRYFGGTLLGAGGLVRAYGAATAAAVEDATRSRRRVVEAYAVRTSHRDAGRLEHRLRAWAAGAGAVVGAGRYGASGASFDVLVPLGAVDAFDTLLAEGATAYDLRSDGRVLHTLDP